jgi:hypothetical protein
MPSGQEKFIFSPGFVLNFLNVDVFVVKVVVVTGVVMVGVVVLGVEVWTDAKSNSNCLYDSLLQKKYFQDYLHLVFQDFSLHINPWYI